MAITKVSSTQTKNESLPRILSIRTNNGTGTRSTTSSATPAALACTGDTSYTAPADTNVDIMFTMHQMATNTLGVTRFWLSINGVAISPGTYMNTTPWTTATVVYKVSVDAGQTITIGVIWNQEGGGTATVTNRSTDLDGTFPNNIVGLVIARPI